MSYLIYFLFAISSSFAYLKNFDDSVLFKIDWQKKADSLPDILSEAPEDTLTVAADGTEKFVCVMPDLVQSSKIHSVEYFGPSPHDLIHTLHEKRSCTYRVEIYWTYELCHGQYLLQYHEEQDLKRTSRQEFYLGQYIAENSGEVLEMNGEVPKKKIDDYFLPYYAVNYTQGTLCDINGRHRGTTLFYVCDLNSKGQIHSFTEVSSCEYEMIILTPLLCTHPSFRREKTKELRISCLSKDGAPETPSALTNLEKERRLQERLNGKPTLILPFATNQDSELVHNDPPTTDHHVVISDQSLTSSFLAGAYCLHGGGGESWWKYEYCHGLNVSQYHEEPETAGHSNQIILGIWDEKMHRQWIANKPHKKPVRMGAERKIVQVSHYYSGGDACDVTGERRSVEVRLKCKLTPQTPNAVSLFLLEPKSCQYILGVESHMLCQSLLTTDEDGLFT